MAIEPNKDYDGKEVPPERVEQHRFEARPDIKPMTQDEAALRFLEVLPEEPEQAYDVYESEADLKADRRRKQTGLLNEADAGESEPAESEDRQPEPEVEEDFEDDDLDFEEGEPLDSEVEEEEEFDEEDEEPLYIDALDDLPDDLVGTVKVDGEDVEVTLEDLRSSYSFRSHNTRTAQKLAEERREVQEAAATARQQRERYIARLAEVEEALGERMPEEPDWDRLEKESPSRFAAEHAKWQRRQQALEQATTEREQAEQEHLMDLAQEYKKHLAQEQEALLEVVPEWHDPETAKQEQEQLVEFATSLGFSEEEAQNTDDHRIVLMMRKAMKYDELVGEGEKIVKGRKKKKSRKRALKPGGTSRKRRTRKASARRQAANARRKLAESGSVDDFTQALLESDLLD